MLHPQAWTMYRLLCAALAPSKARLSLPSWLDLQQREVALTSHQRRKSYALLFKTRSQVRHLTAYCLLRMVSTGQCLVVFPLLEIQTELALTARLIFLPSTGRWLSLLPIGTPSPTLTTSSTTSSRIWTPSAMSERRLSTGRKLKGLKSPL